MFWDLKDLGESVLVSSCIYFFRVKRIILVVGVVVVVVPVLVDDMPRRIQ